ncbi:MAG: alpha/beta hydrolase [Candidatus Omnitrophica bacterium]|nr:alpha/beta hydrolase [Candidatus Omnitrophota bacterium]MBI5145496.1 alpha/beta hydrolase [Candidatus Omnitrophota bacterium]
MAKSIFYLLILGAGLILLYVKYIEHNAVFFPDKVIEFYPPSVNLLFEDIYILTEDGVKLNAWFIPGDNAKYTLLFCHGNAGNIGHRLEKLQLLKAIGLNILIFDYRGYGKSKGSPSEKGLYLDAKAAYLYLVNTRGIPAEEIILYGESLGTVVAIELAAKVKVRAVIVEGAFSSGKDMARIFYPYIPTFLFSNKFNSLEKIKSVEVPKLFLHSRDDEMVPYALATKLYQAARDAKYFTDLSGEHNNAFLDSHEKYPSAIQSFIEKL